ncbi:hypothetical protein BJX61DRAFT_545801 [Aspergillus egyptiacus]|nr:hypothetical protein BJX61DRAFT_545801 [Aspergillus egyptiacus]
MTCTPDDPCPECLSLTKCLQKRPIIPKTSISRPQATTPLTFYTHPTGPPKITPLDEGEFLNTLYISLARHLFLCSPASNPNPPALDFHIKLARSLPRKAGIQRPPNQKTQPELTDATPPIDVMLDIPDEIQVDESKMQAVFADLPVFEGYEWRYVRTPEHAGRFRLAWLVERGRESGWGPFCFGSSSVASKDGDTDTLKEGGGGGEGEEGEWDSVVLTYVD